MADTSINLEAERWVVETGLLSHLPGKKFASKKIDLMWGGRFFFDAVSEDGEIVAVVSTSAARTATGKSAIAKYQKIKTDALYLLHIKNEARRVLIFTESCMKEYFAKQASVGRFPPNIELLHIPLPEGLQAKVEETRCRASRETSPVKIAQ